MRNFDDIEVLIIHHSASPRNITTSQIRHWHVDDRGWNDIGYNYVIEGEGEVVIGRSLSLVGAHCKGHNHNSIGVCVVGNNTKTKHQWSMSQIASLQDLVFGIKLVFPGIIVKGHSDFANTLCPGVNIQQLLQEG